MPRIFDNIEQRLLDALRNTLQVSERADFCVGYFNLRGWRNLDTLMERWQSSAGGVCRLLVGMHDSPERELRSLLSLKGAQEIDQGTVVRLKARVAQEFRDQLLIGAPTTADYEGLRRLSAQLRSGKLVVKLFLRYKLHAKLYLLYRTDPNNPITGFLGSSNLTFAGLSGQGELNIDVLDQDACKKLELWFADRWQDKWCLDISRELADIIDDSLARADLLPPYYIYLKMAYHLSEEARTGLASFHIPHDFRDRLFAYQVAAVKIAAHHLNKRGGVLLGDVVGLGKTLMATALARIMQDDFGMETLVICPKNLVSMWEDYLHAYHLVGTVRSLSTVINDLPNLRRYRLLILDESHNLRNAEGKRYTAIKTYIEKNECKCILLSATPYNKSYLDLSAQLRLFLSEEQSKDLGVRPEQLVSSIGESTFYARYQCPVRSLAAFEKSEYADDWRELMRLYLVRRTRSFIRDNYAERDAETGRTFLRFSDGSRSYFPLRVPRTVIFQTDGQIPDDPYAKLYDDAVVEAINTLSLPRYGLANYIAPIKRGQQLTPAEKQQLESLSRAGKRLMGFCRTNLFKRLESGGPAFIESVQRHILRNFVFLHAIEQGQDLPLGTQDAGLLDPQQNDIDEDALLPAIENEGDASAEDALTVDAIDASLASENAYRQRAAEVYQQYQTLYRRRFKWIRPTLFTDKLKRDLLQDARALLTVLARCGRWDASRDRKLAALVDLLTQRHPQEKVLIFTQFADTVAYLTQQLRARGIGPLEAVTGASEEPTRLAWRFSPRSNGKPIDLQDEIRVLLATDVLSEGQNLQDAAIVVNYDLPWAIIRLVQRVGRVDRIGQQADLIACYSFLPAEGVERILHLRERVRQRLQQNAEVVGTDEAFFEDEGDLRSFFDLYNEKAGVLDNEGESEVDLASQAYQIWKNATEANPRLKTIIEKLPNVAFSVRPHHATPSAPEGALVYMRTADGNDALAWVNRAGESVTQSQLAILRAAACDLDTPALPLPEEHHELVRRGVEEIIAESQQGSGGQLGRPSGARLRTYERLKHYVERYQQSLFPLDPELPKAIETIYRYPLQASAKETLNRQLRSGIDDDQLAQLVLDLFAHNRLCHIQEDAQEQEPHIICSLSLRQP